MKKPTRLAVLTMLLTAPLGAAHAAKPAPTAPQISLDVSEGRLITLPSAAGSVFVADPAIADVQVPAPNRVFVFGKKFGHTTLYALSPGGAQILQMTVEVHPASGEAQKAITAQAPNGSVTASGSNNALVLQGTVPEPITGADTSRSVLDISKDPAGADKFQIDNRLKLTSPAQVTLRVWIGEVSRTISKELNFNLNQAIGGEGAGALHFFSGRQTFQINTNSAGQSINGPFLLDPSGGSSFLVGGNVMDGLASEGLVTTLAEPNLTAMSGESASFLAGGEFPIPVPQPGGNSNTITIEYKTYGVSLSFVPTVLASNRISLLVRPEVSQLDQTNEVSIDGVTVPGLTVQRAETTVELGSGESFAIAGLLQNNTNTRVSRFPGLGDLPVVGALFRSSAFKRNESELVIVVTPYVARPVDDPSVFKLPTTGVRAASDLERIFHGRVQGAPPTAAPGAPSASVSALGGSHLAGDAGFDLE
jgi:pilus assembly protein CpaC